MDQENYKKSKQRDAILSLLLNTDMHPSADWLYDQLKPSFPKLSMGTVYRNLNILIKQKLVIKIDSGSTFDRFEANIEPHYHFICESCGAIKDLSLPINESLNSSIQAETEYKVFRHKIDFFGLCDKCNVQN